MAFQWLRPTKKKLILFVIVSLLLFYTPIVPTLTAPVVLEPTYSWNLRSPAYALQSVEIVGVSNKYFGTFAGADAVLVSVAFTLLIAYLFSCVLIYLLQREPKTEKEMKKEKENPEQP